MNFLLFQVHGSIVSWGSAAGDQQRPTDRIPTKSAILGLLAASLGVQRSEQERHQKLASDLRFGVAVQDYGEQMRDYQTALPPGAEEPFHATRREELKWGTGNAVISYRSYRVGGLYTIVLSTDGESGTRLPKLKSSLISPHFIPYLGRKSCPVSLPFDPMIIEQRHPLDAVSEYWDARSWPESFTESVLSEAPDQFDFYWEGVLEESELFEITNRRTRKRRDQPVSRERWVFDNRNEVQARVRRK